MELHTLSTLCVEPNIPPKTNQQWDEEVSLNYPAGDKEIQGTWSCCRYMQRGGREEGKGRAGDREEWGQSTLQDEGHFSVWPCSMVKSEMICFYG